MSEINVEEFAAMMYDHARAISHYAQASIRREKTAKEFIKCAEKLMMLVGRLTKKDFEGRR